MKDFFHDFSDIFFAIIIAGIMFIVLTINLGNWFNEPVHTVLAGESTGASENQNEDIMDDRLNNNMDEQENNNMDEQENNNIGSKDGEPEIEDDIRKTETEKQQDDNDRNSNINEGTQEGETIKETKKIIIPSGTSGTGIARILKENELIDDINDFVQAAENLNLSRRLKSGSFEIPVNTTVENIIGIIAGREKM